MAHLNCTVERFHDFRREFVHFLRFIKTETITKTMQNQLSNLVQPFYELDANILIKTDLLFYIDKNAICQLIYFPLISSYNIVLNKWENPIKCPQKHISIKLHSRIKLRNTIETRRIHVNGTSDNNIGTSKLFEFY